jgi:hypothetical protein
MISFQKTVTLANITLKSESLIRDGLQLQGDLVLGIWIFCGLWKLSSRSPPEFKQVKAQVAV